MTDNEPRKIRKSPDDIVDYLDRLDANVNPEYLDVRQSVRYPYRMRAVEVEMTGPDGHLATYVVPTRNISRDGASILVGHYVYPNTEVRLKLLTLSRKTHVVTAKAVHCRYVMGTGSVHEVGLRFARPIEVSAYHRAARPIRLLLVDRDDAAPELVRRLLKTYTLELTYADNILVACDLAHDAAYDLLLVDIDVEDEPAEIVAELRRIGVHSPLVAITAKTGADDRQRCFDAGFDRLIAKPLTHDALARVIETSANEPLVSELADDPDLADLVGQFVKELPGHVSQLDDALRGNDLSRFEILVRTLKGQAGSYGFDVITQVAAWLEKSVKGGAELSVIQRQFNELARWCESAQSRPE